MSETERTKKNPDLLTERVGFFGMGLLVGSYATAMYCLWLFGVW